jgi:predicted PurR-regulated permease PerM
MADIRRDLTRTTLAILCLLLLIGGSLWVLRPFLGALVWAAMIVVATWPLLKGLEHRFGGRRAPAVAVMTLAMLLLLFLPLLLAVDTIVGHAGEFAALARKLVEAGLPQPPDWVAGLPLVGGKLHALWAQLADAGSQALLEKGRALCRRVRPLAAVEAGQRRFHADPVPADRDPFGGTVCRRRGGGGGSPAFRPAAWPAHRARSSVVLAGQAIRGVALGVCVTALVQTVLGGIGLAIAGVPFAALLSAVMLMFCIAQIGPRPDPVPGGRPGCSGPATRAGASSCWCGAWWSPPWTISCAPILIKKGADLPLLLIFAGVIGGLLGFGLVGIFVGPVVLAVTYTLLQADGRWHEPGRRDH